MKRLGSALMPRVRRGLTTDAVLRDVGLGIADVCSALRHCSLFCSLSDADMELLIRHMQPGTRTCGDTVMREGARARSLMLLLDGALEILVNRGGHPIKLASVSRLTVLGEECLVGERLYRTTARLTADALLLTLSLRGFGRFAAAHLVSGVTTGEAHEAISRGAQWLAIRAAPREDGRVPGGQNSIILSELHAFISARAPDSLQICAAARPADAALAAYLLRLWGCEAVFLKERRLGVSASEVV